MYKKIKNKLVVYTLFTAFFSIMSCETTQLEILDSPNAVAPQQSDIDFFLNSIQLATMNMLDGSPLDNLELNQVGMELTRVLHMFGPIYENAYTPGALNGSWRAVYSTALPDIRTMVPLAEEQELYTHVGIAKVLESYMMMTMVDFFGDVPYSEATKGVEFPNPNVDSGAEIYAQVENLLDEAILDFQKNETAKPSTDLFYGGDEAKWIKLANTLKLKIYLQTRLVDSSAGSKINSLLSEGNLITSEDEDFEFKWSTNDTNPDSRHPEFSPNFDNGTSDYMSTSFLFEMVEGKPVEDPRWRYYFYRQVLENTTDPNEQACITQFPPAHYSFDDVFCNFSNEGFWGRNHGDASGIPPDRGLRTTFGLYPVGGQFDDNSGSTITGRNIGLQGAGISPIILSSYVDFMLAESSLMLNTNGDARIYLESAIRKSMDKVLNFSPANVDQDLAPTSDDVDAYVSEVLNLYDEALSTEDKLEVIIQEYVIASFGNGVEPYNAYRRTGALDLQPTIVSEPGPFIRSLFYPQVFADGNSNVEQKMNQAVQVFWDNNPAGFIN
ncbi:SusD/RagB family nutrient-binding outer membrane lipoprotein [uncultured Croceitalea sp.]|uniref:SusD/RagB family nutrient-binding outer membrane lipoprotein n=1 Tax=uncultured Croceitalea sp. TaxID=1798908 RepID=UPI003305CCE5